MKFIYFFIIIDILLSSISYIYCRLNFGFAKTWSFFLAQRFVASFHLLFRNLSANSQSPLA